MKLSFRRFANGVLSSLGIGEAPVRALKGAYMTAMAVLVVLALSGHAILKRQIDENASNSRVINTSAFLKTDSQRIALLARNLVSTSNLTERENIRNEILHETARMEAAKNGLVRGDPRMGLPATRSAEIDRIFFSPPLGLDRKLERFLEESRALATERETGIGPYNPHLRYLRKEASGDKFMADLDALIRQYQAESEERLERLQQIARAVVASQIAILLLIAFLILRPLVARVQRQVEELNAVNGTLERTVVERTAIAEQRAIKLRESEKLALLDPLTDVLNRRGLEAVLMRESGRAAEEGSEWIVILVDLDDFKLVNDQYGHAVGDHVLREVVSVLKASLRAKDLICRVGGDEFLVLLPRTPGAFAVALAEKIRQNIENAQVYAAAFRRVSVSASLGMVTVPTLGTTVAELLRLTHSTLYHSKHSGKNRVSIEIARGAA